MTTWYLRLRWAHPTGQAGDYITLRQAKQLLREWRELLWDDVAMRHDVWHELDSLFQEQAYPPWLAAQFFIHQAELPKPGGCH